MLKWFVLGPDLANISAHILIAIRLLTFSDFNLRPLSCTFSPYYICLTLKASIALSSLFTSQTNQLIKMP